MEDLIKALTILLKYSSPRNPTHCQHDGLIITGIAPNIVSKEDRALLKELGFYNTLDKDRDAVDAVDVVDVVDGDYRFYFFHYGSA